MSDIDIDDLFSVFDDSSSKKPKQKDNVTVKQEKDPQK